MLYNPQVTDIKCNIMTPYTLYVRIGWIRSSKGDGSDSFTTWIAKKWKVNILESNLHQSKDIIKSTSTLFYIQWYILTLKNHPYIPRFGEFFILVNI